MDNGQKNKGKAFSPKKFLVLCVKSWPVFVVSVVACCLLSLAYGVWKTPTTDVEAQLMLQDGGSSTTMMLGDIARSFSLGDMFGGSSSTDNEASMMRSHTVFMKTARQLDLNVTYMYKRMGLRWTPIPLKSPVRITAPESVPDTLSCVLQFNVVALDNGKYDVDCRKRKEVLSHADNVSMPYRLHTPYGDFTFDLTPNAATPEGKDIKKVRILYSSYASAAESYAKLVKVFVPDRKTDFIGLSMTTVDPKFGEEVLDHVIENYIELGNGFKEERVKQSLQLVNDRLASLMLELDGSDAAMEQFKKANHLTDVEVDAGYLMGKTGELESGLLKARTNFEVIKMTRDFINDPANNYALIPDLFIGVDNDNPSQISTYNELVYKRMEMLNTAKPNNAAIKQLDDQIDAFRENIITSVNRLYDNAKVHLQDMQKENSRTQTRLGQLPALERKYITLQRDRTLQNQMYLFLLQQREELNMSLSNRSLPAQVIDAPHALVTGSSMSKAMLIAVGVLLGLILGAVYVFLMRMGKAPVTSLAELRDLCKVPVLGNISKAGKNDSSIAMGNDNANAETFRQLRSQVQNALHDCDGNTVLVTSLGDNEGKTYVAANLAAALAKPGYRVIVVDAALRRPTLAAMFGISNPTPALADYVGCRDTNAAIDIRSAAIDNTDTVDVVTAAASDVNAADVLGSPAMKHLMEQLRKDYDYVVIDASRIDGYSDVDYLTDLADITLIVCRAGSISSNDIERLNDDLAAARYKRMAIVTNALA